MLVGTGDPKINLYLRDYDPGFYKRIASTPKKWVADALMNHLGIRHLMPETLRDNNERIEYAYSLLRSAISVRHLPKTKGYIALHNWRQIEAARLRKEHKQKWAAIHGARRAAIRRKIKAEQSTYMLFASRARKRYGDPIKSPRRQLVGLVKMRKAHLQKEAHIAWEKAQEQQRKRRKTAEVWAKMRARPRRNREIYWLRQEGFTLRIIGDMYGLSQERVRTIIAQQDRRLKRRISVQFLPKAPQRPVDMGGPRGEWLTFTPETQALEFNQ